MSAQKTETKAITIQGITFEVSEPYAEGHTCTEAEAKALNQTRHENIRNNMARVIKAKLDGREVDSLSEGELSELASAVADYDAGYEFTLASVAATKKKDPIEVEATKIARAAITAKLREAGRKVGDVDKDTLAAAIEKVAASDAVMKQAAANIKQREAIAKGALDDLDLG